jgi:IclR family KDG regulon transcriptional repressor
MSTIANIGAVLRLFNADRRIIFVTEAAELLAMPKSSASRLLKLMNEEGLLASLDGKPGYTIGNLILEKARVPRGNSSLDSLVDEVLTRVCAATGHTGYMAILDGADIFCVRIRYGSHALRVVTLPGYRAQAFATATGRALLARFDDDKVRALHPPPLTLRSRRSPQSMSELLAALANIRQHGWDESYDEAVAGVGSIAVSVFDPESGDSLAFCISYSAHMVGPNEKARIVSLLLQAGKEVGMKVQDPFWVSSNFSVVADAPVTIDEPPPPAGMLSR